MVDLPSFFLAVRVYAIRFAVWVLVAEDLPQHNTEAEMYIRKLAGYLSFLSSCGTYLQMSVYVVCCRICAYSGASYRQSNLKDVVRSYSYLLYCMYLSIMH